MVLQRSAVGSAAVTHSGSSTLNTPGLTPAAMTLQEDFEKAAEDVKKVKTRPTNEELLNLYGLYKQAMVGDVNIEKPGVMDPKGKAKWEAWDSRKGMSTDCAMTTYITVGKEVISKYGM